MSQSGSTSPKTKAAEPTPPSLANLPPDTVIVHTGFGRGFNAPSLSPAVVKLETFLRVAKIPYQAEHTTGMSKKGKTPWISYNEEQVADSELCIKYLSKTFNVNLQGHLSAKERADVFAYRVLTDEFLYWCLCHARFVMTPASTLEEATKLPTQAVANLVNSFKSYLNAQGVGRHSAEEVMWMTENCFKALRDKLGEQPYFFGDKPTEADCAIFGSLAQCRYQMPGAMQDMVTNKYPTLGNFVERMKSEYWLDWDECHSHMNTKQPTK